MNIRSFNPRSGTSSKIRQLLMRNHTCITNSTTKYITKRKKEINLNLKYNK